MKNGDNTLNKRKHFFEVTNNKYYTKLKNVNDIWWIDVFEDGNLNIILGITQLGEWIIYVDKKRYYILRNSKMFLYCAKLVEIPYETIWAKIHEHFKNIIEEQNIDVATLFPFFEIAEFIFVNLLDDYWINLAWLWYEKFSPQEQYKLILPLENIINIKKISQKNRQRARSEIKKLRNGIDILGH